MKVSVFNYIIKWALRLTVNSVPIQCQTDCPSGQVLPCLLAKTCILTAHGAVIKRSSYVVFRIFEAEIMDKTRMYRMYPIMLTLTSRQTRPRKVGHAHETNVIKLLASETQTFRRWASTSVMPVTDAHSMRGNISFMRERCHPCEEHTFMW